MNTNARLERRRVAAALAATLLGLDAAGAPPARRTWRIGVLLHNFRFERLRLVGLLPEIGLVEGRNLVFEVRSTQGVEARLDTLALELVEARVDLIVAPNNPEVGAAMRATKTIPIVILFAAAPVETGLVASLARPGGNITGTTTNAPELAGKMVEVLGDLLPGIRRLAFVLEPEFPGMSMYRRFADLAAAARNIETRDIRVSTPADLDRAFEDLARLRPDAMLVSTTGTIVSGYRRIVEFAAMHRLPAIYSTAFPVRDGGLIAYAPDFAAMARRNLTMIAKIMQGTKPADIPVEQPSTFELVLNLRTAQSLGLSVPRSLLLRADEVLH
jgi:putative ABC transport system substrate-binding protein